MPTKNPRRDSGDAGSLGDEEIPRDDVVRGDAAPIEQEEGLGDEEAIRTRAYELYLQRGEGFGDEMNDWLQAEREYRERRGQSGGDEARDRPAL